MFFKARLRQCSQIKNIAKRRGGDNHSSTYLKAIFDTLIKFGQGDVFLKASSRQYSKTLKTSHNSGREYTPLSIRPHLGFQLPSDGLEEEAANVGAERDVEGGDNRSERRNQRGHHLRSCSIVIATASGVETKGNTRTMAKKRAEVKVVRPKAVPRLKSKNANWLPRVQELTENLAGIRSGGRSCSLLPQPRH